MIEGVKTKQTKNSEVANAVLTAGSSLGRLPATVAKGLDDLLSKQTVNSVEDMVVHLQNKLGSARSSYERNRKLFGKIIDIELNGIYLSEILKRLDETIGYEVNQNDDYLVPFDKAQQLTERLQKQIPSKLKAKNQKRTSQVKDVLILAIVAGIIISAAPFVIKYVRLTYYHSKGDGLVRLGKKEEALASYEEMLKIDPKSTKAWTAKGIAYQTFGIQHKALEAYDKAIDISPGSVSWYNKGKALHAYDEKEKALDAYNKALEYDSDYVEAWHGRGVIYYSFGKKNEALKSFSKAVEIKPNNVTWFSMGEILLAYEEKEKALDAFDNSIAFDSDYIEAWNGKAATLSALGRRKEAIAAYNNAILKSQKNCKLYRKCNSSLEIEVKRKIKELNSTPQ